MKVFVSPFKNPFLNLALEDYFLREGSVLPVVLFYVNRPSVILGRFQNPWIETRLPYLVEKDIWLVRRQSGGGCVFHDEGNLNFSHITGSPQVDRSFFGELIIRAMKRADIELTLSPRHDLWLNGKKISGSAFKQTKDGSFHHGTFLVHSDLEVLEKSLAHTIVASETKSIASVRSKVVSLHEWFPDVTIEDVIELIADEVGAPPVTLDATVLSHPIVQESFRTLTSWKWLWGETPRFTWKGMEVVKGEGPYGAFTKENMQGKIDDQDLRNLFPDFSEQHRSSSLIY